MNCSNCPAPPDVRIMRSPWAVIRVGSLAQGQTRLGTSRASLWALRLEGVAYPGCALRNAGLLASSVQLAGCQTGSKRRKDICFGRSCGFF
jgi:hypothetical protein